MKTADICALCPVSCPILMAYSQYFSFPYPNLASGTLHIRVWQDLG
jgi:hypothetical protein